MLSLLLSPFSADAAVNGTSSGGSIQLLCLEEGQYISSITPQTTQSCTLCPAGSYCPEGISAALPCPLGQFQQQKQQAACISCPENYECLSPTGTVNPVPCPTGRTSRPGSSEGCSTECDYENYYLDEGTQLCKARMIVCNLYSQFEVQTLLNRTQERVCRSLTACSRTAIRLKERSPVDGGP